MTPLPKSHDATAAVFWAGFHLRRHVRKWSVRLWAALFILAALAAWSSQRADVNELGNLVVLALVPLSALFFATGALREEIEDQTLTYGFSRPVDRGWLFAARVAAATAPILVLGTATAVVFGLRIGPETALRFAAGAALSTLVFSGLFSLVGQLMRRPTWLGLAYLVLWEGAVGQVPGFLGRMTLTAHLRAIADLQPEGRLVRAMWEAPSPGWAVITVVGIAAASFVLGGVRVRRREHRLTR